MSDAISSWQVVRDGDCWGQGGDWWLSSTDVMLCLLTHRKKVGFFSSDIECRCYEKYFWVQFNPAESFH